MFQIRLYDTPMRFAYFISPHGFGHASRASAVMNQIGRLDPSVSFDIYTTVPEWFFEESMNLPFRYQAVKVDLECMNLLGLFE